MTPAQVLLTAAVAIAAVVCYHCGYVGGRVDEAAERSLGLAAKERDGREAPPSKLDGTGEEVSK